LNCDDAFRRLGEYLEGALPGPIGEELLSHLQACAPCSEVQRDLQDLSRLSRQCPAPPLPDDLRRRIESFLKGR
jgi:hypothetical protein